jgi:pimeloyl-ACP methyl ester carboxylesterase
VIDVLIMDGTWTSLDDQVTQKFLDELPADRFTPVRVSYPRDYGRSPSYTASRATGMGALGKAAGKRTNPVVIAGYSQGAAIAGDLADQIGRGRWPWLTGKVVACALIADPLRPIVGHTVNVTGGFGLGGQRTIHGLPTFWAAAQGDPITSLPAGSPLRDVADLNAYACVRSPEEFLQWGHALVSTIRDGEAQPWWHNATPDQWSTASGFLENYLVRGRHTTAYVTEGLSSLLGQTIDREVSI